MQSTLTQAVVDTVKANGLDACYIRPLIYRGYHTLGVNPLPCPVDADDSRVGMGRLSRPGRARARASTCASARGRAARRTRSRPWRSPSPTTPTPASSRWKPCSTGYSEGIALDPEGHLSEGSGQNLFLVRDEVLYTPPLSASVLPGITRDSVMTLARISATRSSKQDLPREMLYVSDEVFFVGTAAEVTPIRSVDKIQVGAGRRGPVTTAVQQAFFDYINGVVPDRHGWLTSGRHSCRSAGGGCRRPRHVTTAFLSISTSFTGIGSHRSPRDPHACGKRFAQRSAAECADYREGKPSGLPVRQT